VSNRIGLIHLLIEQVCRHVIQLRYASPTPFLLDTTPVVVSEVSSAVSTVMVCIDSV